MSRKQKGLYTFLYAGQGAQKVGMGKDFYETYDTYRKIADQVSFPFDHLRLMHEGPMEELSNTEYTQPCMSVFAAGVTALLKENGIEPDMALGLSLGEYGALHAAGVLDAKDYIMLTGYRGQKMAEAAKGKECAMSAVLGADADTVKRVCDSYMDQATDGRFVTVANYNCPGQYVICGDETAVSAVEQELKAKGAKRCVRLNVSGPFHTKYMKPAGDALADYFKQMQFGQPAIPVVLNVTGDFLKPEEDLKERLVQQVQNSVRLEESLKRVLENSAEHFIEIGPGNTLAGFLKKCARELKKNITIYTIETAEDLEKLLARGEE